MCVCAGAGVSRSRLLLTQHKAVLKIEFIRFQQLKLRLSTGLSIVLFLLLLLPKINFMNIPDTISYIVLNLFKLIKLCSQSRYFNRLINKKFLNYFLQYRSL